MIGSSKLEVIQFKIHGKSLIKESGRIEKYKVMVLINAFIVYQS